MTHTDTTPDHRITHNTPPQHKRMHVLVPLACVCVKPECKSDPAHRPPLTLSPAPPSPCP